MLRLALALAALVLVAAPAAAGKRKLETLDGARFAIRVQAGERSDARGEESFDEVVSFASKEVALETCGRRGYGPSPYVATRKGDKWLVVFEQNSASDGHMRWEGDVREDWFQGILLWTRKDGRERNFLFKGRLVPEQGAKKKN